LPQDFNDESSDAEMEENQGSNVVASDWRRSQHLNAGKKYSSSRLSGNLDQGTHDEKAYPPPFHT